MAARYLVGKKIRIRIYGQRKRDVLELGIAVIKFFIRSGAILTIHRIPVNHKWGQNNFHGPKCPFRGPQSVAVSPYLGGV